MPPTYFQNSLMSASESWRAIRTIRAEPHESLERVLRSGSARRREFHMALEQAQQQFAAAERIGYESRPLNLFYGLSQAGRAIAAGSNRLGQGTDQDWDASGHGLKYDTRQAGDVRSTLIRQDSGKRDLFSRVSIAIGSPLDFRGVEFGEVMNHLLDYTMAFRASEGYLRPLTDVHVYNLRSSSLPLRVQIPLPELDSGQRADPGRVRTFLDSYPALDGLELVLDSDQNVLGGESGDHCFVIVTDESQLKSRGGQHSIYELRSADYYRRIAVLLPRTGKSTQTFRPLMSWWAVLHALSMLARYAPSRWTDTLSLADSPIAPRIEFLLDSALDAVPELLWEELLNLGTDGA